MITRSYFGCWIADSLFFLHFIIQKSAVGGINGKLGSCGRIPNIGGANGLLGPSFSAILMEDHWTRSVRILTTTCCKSQAEDECILGRLAEMPLVENFVAQGHICLRPQHPLLFSFYVCLFLVLFLFIHLHSLEFSPATLGESPGFPLPNEQHISHDITLGKMSQHNIFFLSK